MRVRREIIFLLLILAISCKREKIPVGLSLYEGEISQPDTTTITLDSATTYFDSLATGKANYLFVGNSENCEMYALLNFEDSLSATPDSAKLSFHIKSLDSDLTVSFHIVNKEWNEDSIISIGPDDYDTAFAETTFRKDDTTVTIPLDAFLITSQDSLKLNFIILPETEGAVAKIYSSNSSKKPKIVCDTTNFYPKADAYTVKCKWGTLPSDTSLYVGGVCILKSKLYFNLSSEIDTSSIINYAGLNLKIADPATQQIEVVAYRDESKAGAKIVSIGDTSTTINITSAVQYWASNPDAEQKITLRSGCELTDFSRVGFERNSVYIDVVYSKRVYGE